MLIHPNDQPWIVASILAVGLIVLAGFVESQALAIVSVLVFVAASVMYSFRR